MKPIKMTPYKLDKNDYFNITITPPYGNKTRNLRLSKLTTTLLITIFTAGVIAILIAIGLVTQKTVNHNTYLKLKTNTQKTNVQVDTINEEVKAIQDILESMIREQESIKKTLSKKKYRSAKHKTFTKNYLAIEKKNHKNELDKLKSQLRFLTDETLRLKTEYVKLNRKIKYYKRRYDSTPSIWPVYGYIKSDYGWRIHPKTGRRQYHKGVDIPSWEGAPVKATATGVIEFAGWGGGYGWLIIISHNYGYHTLYAHLSEITVLTGDHVGKGQIIGKIGETGLTTGPHIHYEIRRWQQPLRPHAYLNLDLLTATKLW